MMRSSSKLWIFLFAAALVFQATLLTRDIAGPWIDESDFNGACWSQSAHNTLRAGLWATKGVPSAFYFDPLPIPADKYYTHHPAVLPLTLAGMFAVFGEHEWVARMLPVLFSLASTVLLFFLVKGCAGIRAAALSTTVFVTLPMELHYGRMVNFEPLELTWMFASLLALRRWEQTRAMVWWIAVLATFALMFWTAWLGYLFLLVLCLHYLITARQKNPRLALLFIGVSFASFLLFLAQISWVQPDALPELLGTFVRRMSGVPNPALASASQKITWSQWFPSIWTTLIEHIQPVAWVLGTAGAAIVLRRGRANEPLWWLGWAALCIFVLDAFYVTAFRNASYIHDYAAFYFIAPVAMMAGVALDAFLGWCEFRNSAAKNMGAALVVLVCAFLGFTGERDARGLLGQFHLLDSDLAEPPTLIPDLGAKIRTTFSANTTVLCNFLVYYGPHLNYYAQHGIIGGYMDFDDWQRVLANEAPPLGGVIWLGEPNAGEIIEHLPPGTRETCQVAGIRFLFWKPSAPEPRGE